MGQCVSSGGAASETAPAGPATALVLLPTGELREYPRPATAARVLDDIDSDGSQSQGWFLCDSDRMGFEGAVAAVGGADELRSGRIYFVFPAEARRHGLTREQVAALAVRAADALAKACAANSASVGSGRRRRGGAAVAPLVFSTAEEDDEEHDTVDAAARKAVLVAGTKQGRAVSRSRRPQRRFAPDLTAIPEGEMSE